MHKKLLSVFQTNRIFAFLVTFRWASLLPAVLTLNLSEQPAGQLLNPVIVFVIALLVNLIISVTNRQLNQLVVDHPSFLVVDLIFTAGILVSSDGTHSPYYLYALSPLLREHFSFRCGVR